MLNEKKIRYMTKAAALEEGSEKKNIEISQYFRTDYISLQMLKSAAAYTVSFGILAFFWAGGNVEELMQWLSRMESMGNLLKITAAIYFAGLVLYEAVTYFYFSAKYCKAKEVAAKYNKQLKRINELYEQQETAEANPAVSEKTDKERTV